MFLKGLPERNACVNKLSGVPMKMHPGKEKLLIAALCGAGIVLVGYGMIRKNHPVFLVGIAIVVAAYLVIRSKLKKNLQEKAHQ